MSEVVYFHELTDKEQHAIGEVLTWQQVKQKHPQPSLCSYHRALEPQIGCCALTTHRIHAEDDCKWCDLYRPEGVEVYV